MFMRASQIGSQPVDTIDAARWYVVMKLHREFVGGARGNLSTAFGKGLRALGDGVYCALAAMPEHELLPRIEGQQYMSADHFLRLVQYSNSRPGMDADWFASEVRNLADAELPMLLRFITGLSRLSAVRMYVYFYTWPYAPPTHACMPLHMHAR